jgi:hypothetical protein
MSEEAQRFFYLPSSASCTLDARSRMEKGF